ncbi:hypothetical protein F2Q70_00004625 [Brassica cretica]|uniref:SWIM-type domain-containing protein n=1 Tax=Brassica cretica TaxID=69181 RepID=A0A8S9ILM5_BRACR|nr:hypothetical protein F2Q70_00004625 [Brassica cretica]
MVHKGIEGHDSWYEIEFLSRSVREEDFWVSLLRVDDFPGSRLVKGETTYTEVVRQITYREVVEDFIPRFWSNLCYLGRLPCKSSGGPLPYGCWNFVVDKFKGARLFFLSEGSTHDEHVAMAQKDYNLDMNTESVQLAYSLPEAMMQRMASDTPHIHVTSDRQVQNLLEIAKTHVVCLCVSSLSKMRAVSEEGEEDDEWDEAYEGNKGDEGDEDDDDMAEDENHDGEEDDGEEDDGDEDADILVVAEAIDDAEDYSEYGKVKDEDEDEEEDDDMCFEDFKGTYGSKGGRSYGSRIYVNQMFASKDAFVSELRLTAVRRKFSFRIYKSTKTLLVATCRVNGCGWKIRAIVKHGTNTFWVTKYVETHTCSVGDRIAQRKHCTPKYVCRLFIDRVGIIDGLNPQHIKDAMKNMFGMTLDYTTSYKALLYEQELIADTMSVQQIDGWRFFLEGGKKDRVVDLEHRKCDCGVYGVEKIPCSHAITTGSYAGLHVSTLVCPVYSKDNLFEGYSENIYPCVGQQVEARTCFPPEVKRGPGR